MGHPDEGFFHFTRVRTKWCSTCHAKKMHEEGIDKRDQRPVSQCLGCHTIHYVSH